MKLFQSKKFRHGSLATALTIGFIAIVVIINIIAGLIIDKLPAKLDLTTGGMFEIGDDTKNIISNLTHDINISIVGDPDKLESSSVYYKQISEIIGLYPKFSNRITLKWVDLDKNPEFANKYSDVELKDYDVVIESDLRRKIVNIQDMLEYDQEKLNYYYYGYTSLEDCVKGSAAEQEMTSAIMYVTDDAPVKVEFLTMGETTDNYSTFRDELLGKNAYETETINILTDEIPSDATIAVICAPTKDYSVNEITKLEAFLDNNGESGKSVFYIAPLKNYDTPIIDEFLGSWGLSVGDEYLSETAANNYYQSPYNIWQNVETSDYTADLDKSTTKLLVYMAHPVQILYDTQVNTSTQTLIKTASTAVRYSGSDGNEAQQVGSAGIFNSAAVSAKTNYQNKEAKSYLFVFGSEAMFHNSSLTSDNAQYLLSIFNTNTGKSEGMTIISKTFDTETLEISNGAIGVMSWIFIVIIPLAVIVTGIIIAVKRKNR